jgi:hypothetical protein
VDVPALWGDRDDRRLGGETGLGPATLAALAARDCSFEALTAFTASLCRQAVSAYRLDGGPARIPGMDIVAVLLGIVMFAFLYVLILGIDRV